MLNTKTQSTADAASLAYWGVESEDQPISIVPCDDCGRYVCQCVGLDDWTAASGGSDS